MSEQQFREHLAQTQLSPATQDMMVYEPPIGHAAKDEELRLGFRPLPNYAKPTKHSEFIIGVDARIFGDKDRGIVEWDYHAFLEAAHPYTVIGQRKRLENDTSVRQYLPYTIISQLQDGRVVYALYQRTKMVGESRLGGLFSIGWGGHPDLVDLVTGDRPEDSMGHPLNNVAPSPILNLYETLRGASDREIHEEVNVWDAQGKYSFSDLATRASNLLILDDAVPTNWDGKAPPVGQVHVGLIRHATLPVGWSMDAREQELKFIGFFTIEDLLKYELEPWSKLYVEYSMKTNPEPEA